MKVIETENYRRLVGKVVIDPSGKEVVVEDDHIDNDIERMFGENIRKKRRDLGIQNNHLKGRRYKQHGIGQGSRFDRKPKSYTPTSVMDESRDRSVYNPADGQMAAPRNIRTRDLMNVKETPKKEELFWDWKNNRYIPESEYDRVYRTKVAYRLI